MAHIIPSSVASQPDGTPVTGIVSVAEAVAGGLIVERAIDNIYPEPLRDAELSQTGKWTSLDTFIAFMKFKTVTVSKQRPRQFWPI